MRQEMADYYLNKQGVLGVSLSYRSAESVFNRFKSQILPEVMKYMDITEATIMASGWSMDGRPQDGMPRNL